MSETNLLDDNQFDIMSIANSSQYQHLPPLVNIDDDDGNSPSEPISRDLTLKQYYDLL